MAKRGKRKSFREFKAAVKQTSDSLSRKINLAWKNLVLFAILLAFSYILYNISSSEMFLNLFFTLSIIFGFVTFALLIVLVVLFLIKTFRK